MKVWMDHVHSHMHDQTACHLVHRLVTHVRAHVNFDNLAHLASQKHTCGGA